MEDSVELAQQPAVPTESDEARRDSRLTEEAAAGRESDRFSTLSSLQELVVVEATDDQLEATLAAMQRTPSTFLALQVDPAPDAPEQRDLFSQYNRGRLAPLNVARSRDSAALRSGLARKSAPRDAEVKEQLDDQDKNKSTEPTPADDSTNVYVRQQVAQSLRADRENQLKLKRGRAEQKLAQQGKSRARKLPPPLQAAGAGFGGGSGTAAQKLEAQAAEKPGSPSVDQRAADAQKAGLPRSTPRELERNAGRSRRSLAVDDLKTNPDARQEPQKALGKEQLKRAVFVLNVIDPDTDVEAAEAEGDGDEQAEGENNGNSP